MKKFKNNKSKYKHGKSTHFEHYARFGDDRTIGSKKGRKRLAPPYEWPVDPERGVYNPFIKAESILESILYYWEDPDVAGMLFYLFPEMYDQPYPDDPLEYEKEYREEIFNYFQIPDTYADGTKMSVSYQLDTVVLNALALVNDFMGGVVSKLGEVYSKNQLQKARIKKRYLTERAKREKRSEVAIETVPFEIMVEALAYYLTGKKDLKKMFDLRIANVDKATAADFIEKHHSALPYLPYRGLLFSIGLYKGKRLVAVATANTPTGRFDLDKRVKSGKLDIGNILELTRIASDGTIPNASSILASRIIDLLPVSLRGAKDKESLFVTYSLDNEQGSTYRALRQKGLRATRYTKGKKASGARKGATQSLADIDKIRWEAGSAAGRTPTRLCLSLRDPSVFPYIPTKDNSMPRRRKNFRDTYKRPVLTGQRETSRKQAEDLYVYPKLKKFPIGDEFHARLALIYVMSPTLSKYRKKVIQAVKQAYPNVAWGRWWNSHKKDHPDLKNWGDYTKGMKSNPRRKKIKTEADWDAMFGDTWFSKNFRILSDSNNSSYGETVWIAPNLGFKLVRHKRMGTPQPFRWQHSSGATGSGKFKPEVIEQMKRVKSNPRKRSNKMMQGKQNVETYRILSKWGNVDRTLDELDAACVRLGLVCHPYEQRDSRGRSVFIDIFGSPSTIKKAVSFYKRKIVKVPKSNPRRRRN